jgi:hypothetical protein
MLVLFYRGVYVSEFMFFEFMPSRLCYLKNFFEVE